MAEYSILYLGRAGFASEYLAELETLPCCTTLAHSPELTVPAEDRQAIDIVLLDAGAAAGQAGESMAALIQSLCDFPVVAITHREHENRGIAAVRAGAQGYICIDDVTVEGQEAVFDHAVKRHRLQQHLSATDISVLSVLGNINDGVIVVDREGSVLDLNPAARAILGLGHRWLPDAGWEQTFCCVDGEGNNYTNPADLPLARACSGARFSGQVAIYRAPEQPDMYLSINGQGLFDGRRELVGGVITFRDVTSETMRTTALEKRAQYDELTGLPNRSVFTEHLSRAIGRAQRRDAPLAVLFVDIDRFRSVNDTLGHDVGDGLLRQMAGRLRDNLRIGDYPGRWGSDEFVICLEDLGEMNDAGAAAQKLLLVLSEKYQVGHSEVYATPSIGIATFPGSGNNADRLINAADVAMHEAKKYGGGRFHYYSTALNARLEQREELEVGLRHALVRNEFLLHYQPRIDLASGRLIGLEALLRWQHPRFGLLAPGRFLPILEFSGLIHSAGEWVIATACRQLAGWQRRFELPDLSIAINLSRHQLMHRRLVDAVAGSLEETMLDPGCIELEISNGEFPSRRKAEIEALQGLRKLGVRLSLDHFGTRDISFDSLDKGFVDSFVLDRSLIADIDENDSHQRIVRAAIAMAQGMDIEVAAGGVETLPQLDFLKSCNCNLAQGFLIGRPMQSDNVSALLRSEIAGTRLLASGMS